MSEPGAITPEGAGDDLRVRFRLPKSSYLAVLFLALGVSVLLFQPWFGFLYLVPVAVALFIARRGTDVDADGVTVHALLRSERFPWSQVRGIAVDAKGRVALALRGADGGVAATVRLPCIGTAGLPVLAEASGGALPDLPAAVITPAPGRTRRR
ncbi:PH domain-containing protein [Jatrophihabitans sp. YIM 134969]